MRLKYAQAAPEAIRATLVLDRYIKEASTLEPELIELVKLRASQINGCAYCIDMHTKDARALGMTEQRLYLVQAWHEAPFYSDREQAALAWTEALTMISTMGVSDELYEEVSEHFSEKEMVDLTIAVNAINNWNRIAISFQADVGSYQPSPRK